MKKSIKFLSLILVLITAALLCAACDTAELPDPSTDGVTKVCLIINGNLGDKSFFDSAKAGIDSLKKTNPEIVTNVIEAGIDGSRWEPTLREVSQSSENYDLIIVGTDQMREPLQRIAPQYPLRKYVIFDADINKEKKPSQNFTNVYSIKFAQNEGSFLAGVLAAAWKQNSFSGADKTVGFVGGMKMDIIKDFAVGYYEGILYVNGIADAINNFPQTKTFVSYVGGFTDSATGRSNADAQYNNGAQIIFQAASQSGLGCIDSAKNNNKFIIGVDSDQYAFFSSGDTKDMQKAERIVTSVLKRVDLALIQTILAFDGGTLQFNKVDKMGLATKINGESVIGIVKNDYYKQTVPQSVRELIDSLELKIIAGEIVLKTAYDMTVAEFNAFEDTVIKK